MLLDGKMPKSKFYLIIIFTSIIIMSISLESIIRAKDLHLFQNWMYTNNIELTSDLDYGHAFSSYIVFILSTMFMKILLPGALSIHSYFAYTRLRINRLFIFIWSVLLLGGLAYELIGYNLGSIFFYINIIAYIGLIITIFSLNSVLDN